jgi:hypothetical protein
VIAGVTNAASAILGGLWTPIFASFCKIGNGIDWPAHLYANRFGDCKQQLTTNLQAELGPLKFLAMQQTCKQDLGR